MSLIKIKTADLIGSTLDYMVEIAISGTKPSSKNAESWRYQNDQRKDYSSNWAHGGPLIDNYRIELRESGKANWWADKSMLRAGAPDQHDWCGHGPSALIAVCRSIVQGILGDVVRVPSVLRNGNEDY